MKITKRAVESAPIPARGDAFYWDTELRGFGLRVTPNGVRSYVVQYRLPGKPARRKTIGIHGSPWTPDAAEKKARAMLFVVREQGVDPADVERERRRVAIDLEFTRYVETFTKHYLKTEWGDSWADAKRQLELHVSPHLKGRPLPEIKRSDVATVINGLRDRPALARNTHAVLRKLFTWAIDQGDLVTSPICNAPPAVPPRKRVLSPDEIFAVWHASFGLRRPQGEFVRLLLITLQRRNEVAELPWSELADFNNTWLLDGSRSKNGEDHLIPLSPLAVELISSMGPAGKSWPRRGLLFTTTGETPISGFSKLKRKLDALMLPILQRLADDRADALGEARELVFLEPWRMHDLRRTGVTQMQALGVPIEVTEKVINHLSGEAAGIRKVYNLHDYADEKRDALDRWAVRLKEIVDGAEGASNVVTLAARASVKRGG